MAYVTVAELRAMNGLGDPNVFPDADLQEAADLAKVIIDEYCGTTFGDVTSPAYDSFTVTLDGNGSHRIRLVGFDGNPVLFPRSITAVTVEGVARTGVTFVLQPSGTVQLSDGIFDASSDGGQNVVVSGTAGFSQAPPLDIQVAARAIARHYALDLVGRLSDRALSATSADGSFEVKAQAGGVARPTALPEVNAILNRNRHIWPLG
jgi:hypothetical protein